MDWRVNLWELEHAYKTENRTYLRHLFVLQTRFPKNILQYFRVFWSFQFCVVFKAENLIIFQKVFLNKPSSIMYSFNSVNGCPPDGQRPCVLAPKSDPWTTIGFAPSSQNCTITLRLFFNLILLRYLYFIYM